jgi:hypothetical protein
MLDVNTIPFSVQFVNVYPAFAVAVTVTEEPELNGPPPLVVPPTAGFDDNVTVYCGGGTTLKFAMSVLFPLMVNV